MAGDVAAWITRRNAERAAEALRDAGYEPEARDYPVEPVYGERHYLLVQVGEFTYQAQWHLRARHGTSFMANRGPGWDEATARRLSELVVLDSVNEEGE